MAYNKFEQTYVDAYLNNMYPDVEEEQSQDTMLAAGPTAEPDGQVTVSGFKPQQVKTDVQPALGVARPIPQNKAQEALGYIGELLTKAGVQLDKVGIEIPALGRISLKDLTVGESGKVLEDMALGFYPIEGAGGFISGTTRIKPDPALELLNIAPIAGAAAKVAGKGVVKAGQAVAPKAAEMAEGYMRSIGGIADIVPPSPKPVSSNVSELGFYSAAKQAVDSIQQPKGTGEQFLKQIEKTPGVKPEEIKWTGLDDFLKSKKSVTKVEVQEFLDKNRVEVKEITLESGANPYPYRTADEWQGAIDRAERAGNYDESERLTNAWEVFEGFGVPDEALGIPNQTKFSRYTLPGGENYREILLTLPTKMVSEDEARVILNAKPDAKLSAADISFASRKKADEFKSQHFDQPNILAHLRVNDRVDADGKKVLFVEEVQSDWHQAGRKKGYNTLEQRAADQKKLDALDAERKTLEAEKVRLEELAKPFTNQGKDAPDDILDKWNMTANRLNNLQREYAPIANQLATGSGVPDAPFKTTWHELSMKRAIQLAAEGGYDRVAFTTGKTQAERYDLSKQIGQINARPTPDGKISLEALTPDMGEQVIQTVVKANELDDIVGKEIADKIRTQIEYPKSFDDRGKSVELSGLDLKVGGEGMKGFYDQILPKFLDKYAKKWDAKTGMTEIQAGTTANKSFTEALNKSEFANEYKTASDIRRSEIIDIITERMKKENVAVQYIDVTPKMKESVLTKGQPLFAIGAGGAAVQQEDNK